MESYEKISLGIAVILGIIIFLVSSMSSPPNPFYKISYSSLLYHFGIFLVFGLFFCFGVSKNSKIIALCFLISIIYAGLDELHQYFVPGRFCCFSDFAVDCLGILIGFVLAFVLQRIYIIKRP